MLLIFQGYESSAELASQSCNFLNSQQSFCSSDVFAGVMDFSGMSLIKLKKEEMEAQVRLSGSNTCHLVFVHFSVKLDDVLFSGSFR